MSISSSSAVYLITGASRGLGRAIATAVAGRHGQITQNGDGLLAGSWRPRFLLVARSVEGLEETKNELLSAANPATGTLVPETNILCRSMDLADLDRLDSNIDRLLEDTTRLSLHQREEDTNSKGGYPRQHLVFVNNAASLGHLGPSWKNKPSLEDMRRTIDFNVTSSLWMSVRFAIYAKERERLYREEQQQNHPEPSASTPPSMAATIVNISSLAAVSAGFPGMGIYSAGKAAREMYHTLLARQEDDDASSLRPRYLNYAPGPLETAMTKRLRESEGSLDDDFRSQFRSENLLEPRDSARLLLELLDADDFESGSHVDCYDLLAARFDDAR